ncbi:MAG TPA: sarcosine oxidase subunit gamma family protein [Stellaceae bacterium]|nr:sarcosine oxidase subunit gamma family protein [Stellaceae bacterium]
MADAIPRATLREPPHPLLLNLRGDAGDAAFTRAVAGVLGTAPPTEPNTVAASGEMSLLWLGPDEWLIAAPASASDLNHRLETALQGLHHSLCDVSQGRVVFDLAGPEARAVLETATSLDLHPRVFGHGRCAQTGLARVPAILQMIEPTRFRIYVRLSFAPYVRAWLERAMAEPH